MRVRRIVQIDHLGRVYLPAWARRMAGIRRGDPLAVGVEGDAICLVRYTPSCVFCLTPTDNTVLGKPVCPACQRELAVRAPARPDPPPYVVFADAAPDGLPYYRAAAVAEDGRWAARRLKARSQTEAEVLALLLASRLARSRSHPLAAIVLVTDNRWFRLDYSNPRKPELSERVDAIRKLLRGRRVFVAYIPGPLNPADPISRMRRGPEGEQAGPPPPARLVAAYRVDRGSKAG